MSSPAITYVMSVLCEDRPGQVDAVASVIAEQGGNWLESRMTRLGGRFAGILRVSVPREREDGLLQALQELDNRGITVILQGDSDRTREPNPHYAQLELIGADRPGIVQQISHVLARFDVNVEDLSTECNSAPWSGDSLFKAKALLKAPSSEVLDALKAELERIGGDLMVDIEIAELA